MSDEPDNSGNDTGDKPGPRLWAVPDGDDRKRLTCPDCGFIHYDNPKVIAGVVATWDGRYILCRRAIEPRKGFWTVPAGFLELGETTAEGAKREAWEEARVDIEITGLIGIYEIPRISQMYVLHAGKMTREDHAPGPESAETMLVTWDEIPWDELAFPSIRWALERYRDGLPPDITQAPPRPAR
jgi:ADP-ribose pyrophosphatase YjhB (NUDIX family)